MFPIQVEWSWHHEYVCEVLQDFSDGMYQNLMVFMPPQHSKSTMLTEYYPAYRLGLNPDTQSILTMYNSTLASKQNRKIQRVIDNERYKLVFPDTKLNGKNVVSSAKGSYVRNSDEFEIVGHHGFLKTTGVGGGIAGTPAKLALLDDVIKNAEEANSPTYRNKIYEWYTDELEARLHNDSQVAFTITRRHEDDLAGRLIKRDGIVEEGGKWKVIKLPALKEDNNNPDDPRKIGEALWPEMHSRERMEYIRDKSPKTFAGLYQQRPAALEGNMIKREWFQYYQKQDISDYQVNFYIDGAYTDDVDNDPTGLMAFMIDGNELLIVNCKEIWKNTPDLMDYLENVYFPKHNISSKSIVFVEPKANGLPIIDGLKRRKKYNLKKAKLPRAKGRELSKESRVEFISEWMMTEHCLLPINEEEWTEPFIDECCTFPNAKNDGRVDCLTGAGIIAMKNSATGLTAKRY